MNFSAGNVIFLPMYGELLFLLVHGSFRKNIYNGGMVRGLRKRNVKLQLLIFFFAVPFFCQRMVVCVCECVGSKKGSNLSNCFYGRVLSVK